MVRCVGLDGERPHEPQATFAIGEDAHDLGAAPDLLVQPFQHIGRFEVLMVLPRQPVKEPAPAQAGVSVSSMFSSTQPVSFEYLPDHLVSQAAKSRRASMRSRRSYSRRSSCRQSSSTRRGTWSSALRRKCT